MSNGSKGRNRSKWSKEGIGAHGRKEREAARHLLCDACARGGAGGGKLCALCERALVELCGLRVFALELELLGKLPADERHLRAGRMHEWKPNKKRYAIFGQRNFSCESGRMHLGNDMFLAG